MPTLSLPHSQFKASFLAAVKEYHGENLYSYQQLDEAWVTEHFDEYVTQLAAESRGENLPPGFVAHSTWWLTEGDEYLGKVDIRHQLNDFLTKVGGHIGYDIRPTQRGKGYGTLILKLGLEKAKEMGLKQVLITCDVTNLPSNKVIQSQGGVLEDSRPMGPGKPNKNRYWISV